MGQFRVLAGTHTENNRTYKTGEIVTSSFPLSDMFQNHFEKVFEGKKSKTKRDEEPEPEDEEDEEEVIVEPDRSEVTVEIPSEFGVDVTDDFPGAREGQLRVFHNDDTGLFTVVLAEKPLESLSDTPLKNRRVTLKCVTMNAVPA